MNAPDPISALLARGGIDDDSPLTKVFSRTNQPIVVTDAQRRTVWVNQAFVDLTGYSLEEVTGRSPGALLQCEDTDQAEVARLRAALDAGRPVITRLLNRSKSGRRYVVELEIHPFGPPAGPPLGFIAVQPDLAERIGTLERVRTVLDFHASGLLLHDETGRILDANLSAEQLLGLGRDELLGRVCADLRWQLLNADGKPLSSEQHPVAQTQRSGRSVRDAVIGVQLPDGRRRWLRVHTAPLPREDGPSWVMASFADATAQREMLVQMHAQWQCLRSALDSTRISAWEWDIDTGEVRCDARWAEIVGLRTEDTGRLRREDCAKLIHPDDIQATRTELLRHFAGEQALYALELRIRHSSGNWRWVRSSGVVVQRDADGRALRMVGANEDITERKEAELAAAATQAMLQGLFELAPVGISRIDLQTGQAMDFNDALCRIVGRSRDDLIASGGLGPHFTHEYVQTRQQNLLQALETGHYGPTEAVMLHASGRRVDVVLSGARVLDHAGRPHVWSIVQDVTRYKQMEAELRAAAEQDPLTGLPNRNVLMKRLSEAQQRAAADPDFVFAVLFLDFDRFKLVNDTLGHDAGDELLVLMAQRMSAVLCGCEHGTTDAARAEACGSFVARFGGDEFVIVAAGIDGVREAKAIAERLHAQLSPPYEVKGQVIQSGVSIGLAMGDSGTDGLLSLLRNADTAMYEAKRAGRGITVVFDHAMHARLTRSLQIEAGLRLAVARDEFTVLYQPIVDLETGRMSSVEALLRWRHSVLGSVSPAEFIPIAEECGQIVAIGEWVLRQACLQWVRWQREDAARAPAGMSVNLSRVQMLLGNQLLVVVRTVLAESGMPPAALQLEITEREVMKDPGAARELMLGLSALGVRLAMDDFGTGTSSLGCLRQYPFDTIKIDKSFVTDLGRDPHVLAVAHATVNVIENLSMVSVAEGIEDPAEVAMLQAMGCRYGQGYLFARPLPADQVLARMAPLSAK